MSLRIAAVVFLAGLPAYCEWNPRLAADYLDGRQKDWFAWPRASNADGVCVSCHTGLTYMLVRPALRTVLKEAAPTPHEIGLLDALKKRLAGPGRNSAEPAFAALLLASEDARGGSLSSQTQQAFDRLWSAQLSSGPAQGAWNWINADLDPFEEPDSQFYGASLAALAVGTAPGHYASRPEIQKNMDAMKAYLASHRDAQPLHNRLVLVWASTKLNGLLTDADRQAIVNQVLEKQQANGGWTMESLGAWSRHPDAPTGEGSNAYATGLAAFVLQRAGLSAKDAKVARGLKWLRTHQDPRSGFWDAQSMNKRYEAGSMESQFMRDVATSYAALALLEGR